MSQSMEGLYEIAQGDFPLLTNLFRSMEFHLATQSILAGTTTGRAWVDDPSSPQAALLAHGSRYYLAGRTDCVEFNQALDPSFFEQCQGRLNQELFIVYMDSMAWEPVLKSLFKEKKSISFPRQYYETQARQLVWQSRMPAQFTLREVDSALIANAELIGMEALKVEMCSERDSVEEFLEKSFGIAPLNGDQVAGWCLSEYNLGERCEVGIASLPPYQRLGLATACTLAFIDMAFQRGIQRIGWHCYTGNRPSVATALKAGLKKLHDYNVLITWFHEEQNFSSNS